MDESSRVGGDGDAGAHEGGEPELLPVRCVAVVELPASGRGEEPVVLGQDRSELVEEVASLDELDVAVPVGQPLWSARCGPRHFLQAQDISVDAGHIAEQLLAKGAAPHVHAHDPHHADCHRRDVVRAAGKLPRPAALRRVHHRQLATPQGDHKTIADRSSFDCRDSAHGGREPDEPAVTLSPNA